ncbi:MAG TPA: hypothetical protein VF686_01220 [Brevundimonas sp.]|jgi:hypothetical protein
MRWPNPPQPPTTRRPKSKGRLVFDAALFTGTALVMGWAGLDRAQAGRVTLRSWPDVLVTDQPGLFWALIAGHWVIVAVCLGLSGLAIRALLAPSAKDVRP